MSFPAVLLSALIAAVAAPITEHHLLGIEYPIDRIALFYVPLVATLAMFILDESLMRAHGRTALLLGLPGFLLLGAMAVHLSRTANSHHTLQWAYDADTKAAILDIQRYVNAHGVDRKYKVGNNWVFEPTLNFYRRTLSYDWMQAANRNDLTASDNDLVFCYEEDLKDYPYPYNVVRRYPLTNTVLVSIDGRP